MPRRAKKPAAPTLENLRRDNINRAGVLLARKLFGPDPIAQAAEQGYVGVGDDEIHVYIRGTAQHWEQKEVHHYAGYTVVWHYGVGPINALARTTK